MRAKAHLAMVLAAVAARDAELARNHLAEATVRDRRQPGRRDDLRVSARHPDAARRRLAQRREADAPPRSPAAAPAAGRCVSTSPCSARRWPRPRSAIRRSGGRAAGGASTTRFHAVCRWHHWMAAWSRPSSPSGAATARARWRRWRGRSRSAGLRLRLRADALLLRRHDVAPGALAWNTTSTRRSPSDRAPLRLAGPGRGAGERWPWPVRIRTLGRFAIEREGAGPRRRARKAASRSTC